MPQQTASRVEVPFPTCSDTNVPDYFETYPWNWTSTNWYVKILIEMSNHMTDKPWQRTHKVSTLRPTCVSFGHHLHWGVRGRHDTWQIHWCRQRRQAVKNFVIILVFFWARICFGYTASLPKRNVRACVRVVCVCSRVKANALLGLVCINAYFTVFQARSK